MEGATPKDHKYVMLRRLMLRFYNEHNGHNRLQLKEVLDDWQEFQRLGYIMGFDFNRISTECPYEIVFGQKAPPNLCSNVFFQMIRKRIPQFFCVEDAKRDVQIAGRLFVVESAIFLKEVLFAFFPQYRDMSGAITEAHLYLQEGIIPMEFSQAILDFFEITETCTFHFPDLQRSHKLMMLEDLRSFVYRARGERDRALESSRRSLFLLSRLDPHFLSRENYALFLCGACFLQYEAIDSLDEVLAVLWKFVGIAQTASEAIEVLSTGRNATFFRLSQVNVAPQLQYPAAPLNFAPLQSENQYGDEGKELRSPAREWDLETLQLRYFVQSPGVVSPRLDFLESASPEYDRQILE